MAVAVVRRSRLAEDIGLEAVLHSRPEVESHHAVVEDIGLGWTVRTVDRSQVLALLVVRRRRSDYHEVARHMT